MVATEMFQFCLHRKDMKAFELSDTSEHVTPEAVHFGSRLLCRRGSVFIVVRGYDP